MLQPRSSSDGAFDPNADCRGRILAASIVLIVLSALAVGLRCMSRRLSHTEWWWDDWMIVLAMLFAWIPCFCMFDDLHHGFGRHMPTDPVDAAQAAVNWFRDLFVFEIGYATSLVIMKYSILLLYWRVFKTPGFKMAFWIMGAIVTAHYLAIILIIIFGCSPIHYFWTQALDVPGEPPAGHCINFNEFFLGAGIPNIITDFALLVMPLPLVWSLQIRTTQKFALSSIFLLGIFVCIVAIIRLVVITQLNYTDITWNYVSAALWTATEPNIGIVSACLPVMRPILKWAVGRPMDSAVRSTRDTHNSTVNWPRNSKLPLGVEDGRISRLGDAPYTGQASWGNHVAIYASKSTEASSSEETATVMGMDDLRQSSQSPTSQRGINTSISFSSSANNNERSRLY